VVHHHHASGPPVVTGVEGATGDQLDSQRTQPIPADDPVVGRRPGPTFSGYGLPTDEVDGLLVSALKRQGVHDADVSDARHRGQAFERTVDRPVAHRRGVVAASPHNPVEGEQAFGLEARIRSIEIAQRADHEAGPDQEGARESAFADDQPGTPAVAARRARRPTLLRQPLAHVLAARMKRGHQPGEHTGQETGDDGKPDPPPVERDLVHARRARREHRLETAEGPAPEEHAGATSQQPEDEALDQKLPRDPHAPGSEGGAHGELFGSSMGAGQLKTGDVGAGDEEHEARCAEQHV
jgi:hypothetical protein